MRRGVISDLRREAVGAAVATGLFAGTLAAGIPVLFAGAAAAAGFWAAWVLVPKAREPKEIVVAPGVSQEALETFVADCSASLQRIEKLAREPGMSSLRGQVDELRAVLGRIMDDCRQDPGDIRVEPQLPALLQMLSSMLERYADVAPRAAPNRRTREQLGKIEEALSTALRWLGELEQRMLRNDIMDGTAQAQTLIGVMKAQLESDGVEEDRQ